MKWRNNKKHGEEILQLIHPGTVVCVFDTETTGISSEDKIIQFSGTRFRVNRDYSLSELDKLGLYINPGMPLHPRIVEITGITDQMLIACANEQVLAPHIFSYLEEADVWAAYNKKFDLRMLSGMAERTRLMLDERPSVDVLEMARDWVSSPDEVPNHKLGTVAAYLLPDDLSGFHNADVDVTVTAMVMEVLLKKYVDFMPKDAGYAVHLESAHLFINPRQMSQQRIRMKLSEGDPGAIFYDIVKKQWGCKSDPKSKKLFTSIDMANLEEQFLSKYGYRFHMNTMDEVAAAWLRYARERKKDKKD